MKNNTEDNLKVLHLIEKHPDITQRIISTKSGLSLGKVNYCIKSLVEKGYIKIENFKKAKNKSRYIYILTPHGISEKVLMTKKFLAYKQAEYEKLYNYFQDKQ